MLKLTVATVIALVAMALGGVALADGPGTSPAGNSGNANCAKGGTTANFPPGWQMNGVPTMPNFPAQAYNEIQTSFHRCTA